MTLRQSPCPEHQGNINQYSLEGHRKHKVQDCRNLKVSRWLIWTNNQRTHHSALRKKFAIDFSFLFSQECFKRIVQLEIVFFFNTFLILYPSLNLIPSRPSLVLKYKLWYRGLNPPPWSPRKFFTSFI